MKKISSLFTIACIGLFLSSCNNSQKLSREKDVIYQNIDTTVSPSENFFMYANGTWIKKNPIPQAYAAWGVGNLVTEEIRTRIKTINEEALKSNDSKGSREQKIGDFYFSGMDSVGIQQAGLKAIAEQLEKIESISDSRSLLNNIGYLHTIGADPLFSIGAGQDAKNSEVMALYFNQGGLGLPNRDYYFNTDERTKKIREDYVNTYLPKMLFLLGVEEKSTLIKAKEIFNLELQLAQKSRKLEDLRDPYANYNKKSIADLSKLTPSSNWSDLLMIMRVPKTDSIIIGQPEFFVQADKLIRTIPLSTWKNYLKINLIESFSDQLNSEVADESFRFYGALISGRKAQLPRWKRVLATEENLLGELLGQIYVDKYCSEKTKERYTQMTENVVQAYRERIEKLDWMSNATKEKSLKKLNSISKKILYPNKWIDYSSLEIDRGSYAQNVIRCNNFAYLYNINKLNKAVDRTEWGMTPQTYNAYYNPSNNEIVLPAAIFIIPGVSDTDIDDAVVYGYGAASTIGHELTHGFDDEGRQYDEKGNLNNWWTKEDEIKFQKKANLMVEQFNNYVVLDSMHINGKATLGENIADLGGVVLGLEAFKKTEQYKKGESINGLSPVQRYFLGYAIGWLGHQRDERLANQILTDVHAPAIQRVNGPFSNVPEFYEAFNIQAGSPMWRPDSLRVKIW